MNKYKIISTLMMLSLLTVGCGSTQDKVSTQTDTIETTVVEEEISKKDIPESVTPYIGSWVLSHVIPSGGSTISADQILELQPDHLGCHVDILDDGTAEFSQKDEPVEKYEWTVVNGENKDYLEIDGLNFIIQEKGFLYTRLSDDSNDPLIGLIKVDSTYSGDDFFYLRDKETPEVVDSGFTVREAGGGVSYYTYAVSIKNTSDFYNVSDVNLQVSFLDSNGNTLKTITETSIRIPADSAVYFSKESYVDVSGIADIQFSVQKPLSSSWYVSDGISDDTAEKYIVDDINSNYGAINYSINGTITNTTSEDLSILKLCAVLKKDGAIVGGLEGYVNSLAAESSQNFTISSDDLKFLPEHDEVIVVSK